MPYLKPTISSCGVRKVHLGVFVELGINQSPSLTSPALHGRCPFRPGRRAPKLRGRPVLIFLVSLFQFFTFSKELISSQPEVLRDSLYSDLDVLFLFSESVRSYIILLNFMFLCKNWLERKLLSTSQSGRDFIYIFL